MAELINCSPMPDETILGHYRRVIWVNGLRGLRELTPEVDASDLNCFEESDLRHYEAIFRLSGSRTRSVLSDYFRDHSLFVQLLTPVEIARQGGLRLLFRWIRMQCHLVQQVECRCACLASKPVGIDIYRIPFRFRERPVHEQRRK